MKNMCANIIAPDGKPHFAASHLGLLFLPMSNKKDARRIWVYTLSFTFDVIFLRILKLVFKPQSHIHGFGPGRATVHPDLASR